MMCKYIPFNRLNISHSRLGLSNAIRIYFPKACSLFSPKQLTPVQLLKSAQQDPFQQSEGFLVPRMLQNPVSLSTDKNH